MGDSSFVCLVTIFAGDPYYVSMFRGFYWREIFHGAPKGLFPSEDYRSNSFLAGSYQFEII